MSKKRDILITALFCGFVGIMAIGTAFLPKETVSVNEKRTLALFPELSAEKLINGKWERGFESYISDHFPMRNLFTSIDSYYLFYSGRNGSKGVYKGKDGYLINAPVKYDKDILNKNMSAVMDFARNTKITTKVLIVPSAGYIMSDKLPDVHTQYHDGNILDDINQECADTVEFIDISQEFIRNREDKQLYYKTDHHWTSEGAYLAYKLWAENEGIAVREKQDYSIEKTDGFFGTTYTKSALWNEKPDAIEIWEYPINVSVLVEDSLGDKQQDGMFFKEYDRMFFKEHLEEQDKYPVFFDGNHGFERIINNDNSDGRKILVVKDSYAHSFVPFMAENCSQIDMVDLRYYMDSVSQLTEGNNYDEVLIIYGMSNLCEANDLAMLE